MSSSPLKRNYHIFFQLIEARNSAELKGKGLSRDKGFIQPQMRAIEWGLYGGYILGGPPPCNSGMIGMRAIEWRLYGGYILGGPPPCNSGMIGMRAIEWGLYGGYILGGPPTL